VFLVTPTTTNLEPNWSNYENIVTTLYRENKVSEDSSIYPVFYNVYRVAPYLAAIANTASLFFEEKSRIMPLNNAVRPYLTVISIL
jgi:hypothetical protein